MNACCKGWRTPSDASPSIVVTERPSYCTASAKQERIRSLPSTSTVHAAARSLVASELGAVEDPRRSRSRSSNETRGSADSFTSTPLIRIGMVDVVAKSLLSVTGSSQIESFCAFQQYLSSFITVCG